MHTETQKYTHNEKLDSPLFKRTPRVPDHLWKCEGCGTSDLGIRYKGSYPLCFHCATWQDTENNNRGSKYEHRRTKGLKIEFSKEEFLEWCWERRQNRHCHYCGIPEQYVCQVSQKADSGRQTQRLGIDRLDSNIGYKLDNIVLCCIDCNRAKSNTHSADLFKKYIAPGIRKVHLINLGYTEEQIDRHDRANNK